MAKKKEKSPAYQYYPKDMETDEVVKLMNNRQRGIYHRLLDHNWLEGSIPAEIGHLATLVHENLKDFEAMWPLISKKFRKKGSRLTNPRQERERKKQKTFSKKQADAAHKRWEHETAKKSKDTKLSSVPVHQSGINPADAKPYSSSSSSFASADINTMFEFLWEKYPKKDGKKAAFNHFRASLKSGALPTSIKAALENYLAHIREKGIKDDFIKNGSTFFNNWQDWENHVPKSVEAKIRAEQTAKQKKELEAMQSMEVANREEAFNEDLGEVESLPFVARSSIYEEAERRLAESRVAKDSKLLMPALLVEVWRERRLVPV